jgi:DNA segregation ATPase FtsK/SpoIIIE-like protein
MLQNKPEDFKLVCIDSMGVEYLQFLNTPYSLLGSNEVSFKSAFRVIDLIIQETDNRLNLKKQFPKVVCVIDDFVDVQTDFELQKSSKFDEFINKIPLMNSVGIYIIFSTTRLTKNFITDRIKNVFSNRLKRIIHIHSQ